MNIVFSRSSLKSFGQVLFASVINAALGRRAIKQLPLIGFNKHSLFPLLKLRIPASGAFYRWREESNASPW